MSLDLEIQALLRSAEVQSINFVMRGIVVSGIGFGEVSNCFSTSPMRHRIRVTVREVLLPRDVEASYDPVHNKIHLRSATVLHNPLGRGAVVHECTHAQVDLRALGTTPIRSEEGAAFIAHAWYHLACGESVVSVAPGFPMAVEPIAIGIRNRVLAGGSQEVTANEINAVRRIVAEQYPNGHYRSDGIRGRRYSGP